MITFSRKKAAALTSGPSSRSTAHQVRLACSCWKHPHGSDETKLVLGVLQDRTAEQGAGQSLPNFFNTKIHPSRAQLSNDSAVVCSTGKGKAMMPSGVSRHGYGSQELQHPQAGSEVKAKGITAPSHKLPFSQDLVKGRCLPPAPTTATKKLPTKSCPGQETTPPTDPDTLSCSYELETSSGTSDRSVVSSDEDPSSYEPSSSSRERASTDTARRRGPPAARPPLHPRTSVKHGHNAIQAQTSVPRASAGAAKPSSKESHMGVLQVRWFCCHS